MKNKNKVFNEIFSKCYALSGYKWEVFHERYVKNHGSYKMELAIIEEEKQKCQRQ